MEVNNQFLTPNNDLPRETASGPFLILYTANDCFEE